MPSIHHSAFRIHHFDMRFKILVGIYVVVLAVIIFLANRRDTAHLFRFIRELPFGDKIGHLVLMGFLSFLVNLALSAKVVKIWRFNVLLGSIIVLPLFWLKKFRKDLSKLGLLTWLICCLILSEFLFSASWRGGWSNEKRSKAKPNYFAKFLFRARGL